ncbi:hypothetical protein WA016_05800 [Myxococcus stipitatus]
MRRRLLIVLLGLGTVGGFASGFASLAHRHHGCPMGGWAGRWRTHAPWAESHPASSMSSEPVSSLSPSPAPSPRE